MKGQPLKSVKDKAPVDTAMYLASNDFIPADSKFAKDIAMKICKGKKTDLAKARAIYEWTIQNTTATPM